MHSRGFTLIEILIVMAIVVIIGISVIPDFFKSSSLKDLGGAGDRIVAVLRDAQSRSLTAENQKVWGVKFDSANNNFSMSTFVSGAFEAPPVTFASLKNSLKFIDPALPSGVKQIVFSSLTGKPTSGNDVTIIIGLASYASDYKTITVYANGRIEIQ